MEAKRTRQCVGCGMTFRGSSDWCALCLDGEDLNPPKPIGAIVTGPGTPGTYASMFEEREEFYRGRRAQSKRERGG